MPYLKTNITFGIKLWHLSTASFVVFFLLFLSNSKAQSVVNIDSLEAIHPPRKSAIRSAVLPGWGQATNRKFWKIPIIYAGAGTLAYFVHFNNEQYGRYKTAYKIRLDNNPNTIDEFESLGLQTEDLVIQKDYWRRNRDLCIIGLGALYALNIIDAYVDAHLFYFDVSEKMSLQVVPQAGFNQVAYTGIYLNLKF
jgi:hypothetical protein